MAIHINDTHPALVIPELMRILMDVYSYSWDKAWSVVSSVVSYTNHTVMPEALECWNVDLFKLKLPRIYMITEEINRGFAPIYGSSIPETGTEFQEWRLLDIIKFVWLISA